LPISLSGAGVRESIVVYLLHLAGVETAVTAGVLLVFLSVAYLISSLIIVTFSKEFNLKKIKKIFQNENPD
jgi:hypothetical protein